MAFDPKWITEGLTKAAIDFTEVEADKLKQRSFTTTQFRNIYSELKRIEQKGYGNKETQTQFLLLKPKLAYAVARDGGDGSRAFKVIFVQAYDCVNNIQSFNNFCNFIESLLAFHKAAGGK